MFAGRHIGSRIWQRQRLDPVQDMKPMGDDWLSCICTGRRVSGFYWSVQRRHCQLAAWFKKLVSCLEGCRLWVLDQAELAPQPMPAVPENEGSTSLNNCTNHSLINHCRPTVTGARQPMRVEWYGTCSVPYHSALRVGACSSEIKCGIWVTCVYRMWFLYRKMCGTAKNVCFQD